MGQLAIRAEGLGKQYRIDAVKQSYKTVRDSLMDAMRGLGARLRPSCPWIL